MGPPVRVPPARELALPGGPDDPPRKDRFLVPINTDFDLYSVGRDGESAPPLGAATSRDDVVRAANGAFTGLASRF